MRFRHALIAVLIAMPALPLAGDEGMWLFNAPPIAQVKAKYGFEITQPWLDHLRLSSLRFDVGGSGSFVSADGLAFTNHHVASDCLHGLSSARHDYVTTGFYARTRHAEHRCPNLELDRLLGISDVTDQVTAAVKPGMNEADAANGQRAVMAQIEKDCAIAADIRCDVVTLYSGAKYSLYRYKRYNDVRLVFAPEFQIAFFGGDPDNFEYPRYDLDIAFFRVYENGKPLRLKNYLRWSAHGAKEGDLVFVSGNPGSTAREDTLNHLEFLRNVRFPFLLKALRDRIALLQQFAAQSPENARVAQEYLFGYQNAYKAYTGYLGGLNDAQLMNRKKGEERRLLIMSRRNLQGRDVLPAFQRIDDALGTWRKIWIPLSYLEDQFGFVGQLAGDARLLVRAAGQRQLPNGERLPQYRDSALPQLQQTILSTAPISKALNKVLLEQSLAAMQHAMGDDPAVKKLLNGHSPKEAADEAIDGTRLDQVEFRKQLYQSGTKAIAASDDPLVVMMREIEPEALELRKQYDQQVRFVLRQRYAEIERFRFAIGGPGQPPDATFTLRLSYGAVKGYTEDGRGVAPKGTRLPAFTDLAGAFEHAAEHGSQAPYQLPASWLRNKARLDLKTPLNFVSTPDIIGGNSGSPVVNKNGELVGIIFDIDIQSLPWDFQYDDITGRAVSVDSRGIIEALRKIYHAGALADELTGTRH